MMQASQPIANLLTLTLDEATTLLHSNRLTSTQLVSSYLTRIASVNPSCNAVLELNPSAAKVAAERDRQRQTDPNPSRFSKLHGIPILLKDNIVTLSNDDQGDDMQATSGSFALVGAKPAEESDVVTALRRAGAVVLGKANMAEWCGFRSTSGCSGWSARGGQARGIFHADMKASGSSTGSAIATALGLCFAAIGTETCYSIVSPAERSGVVGFKPTKDLVPSKGIIHSSHSQDTVGVLTRSVRDAGELVAVIARSAEEVRGVVEGGVSMRILGPRVDWRDMRLDRLRVGVPFKVREMNGLPAVKRKAFLRILRLLRRNGARVVEGVEIKGAGTYEALSAEEKQVVLDTDMKIAINTYLGTLRTNPNNINTLDDVIAFTKSHPAEEFPDRNVAVLERANATDPDSKLYRKMTEIYTRFADVDGIPGALRKYSLDVIVVPSLSVMMSTFAAIAGSPALSLPMGIYPRETAVKLDPGNGMVDIGPGIPFSLYIYGDVGRDSAVLDIAHSLEKNLLLNLRDHIHLTPKLDIGDLVDIP